MASTDPTPATERSEFLTWLRNGAIVGAIGLAIAIPWLRREPAPPAPAPAATRPQAPAVVHGPLPDFGGEAPSADALHVANWAFFTRDHQGKAVVILDKKAAKVYAFDARGRLLAATPALLGSAVGDDSAPGIGDKPLSQIKPDEKTTPAGRFVAEPGRNANGEDIVWIDYDAAVSMHRVRANVAAERRMERLLSPTEADNRISFGCVNLPVPFYEKVLSPTVQQAGAVVYVLPETRTPQQVFGSYDVTDPAAVRAAAVQRTAKAAPATPVPREARHEREIGG